MNNSKTDKLLEDIKRLMILGLIENGLTGKRIAGMLGVDPAIISRMMPPKDKKK